MSYFSVVYFILYQTNAIWLVVVINAMIVTLVVVFYWGYGERVGVVDDVVLVHVYGTGNREVGAGFSHSWAGN